VTELAADGIPVAVTCRVLNIARGPYCRWRACPVTDTELVEGYRADALFNAHRDDPERTGAEPEPRNTDRCTHTRARHVHSHRTDFDACAQVK
jgi:hypothetical protein